MRPNDLVWNYWVNNYLMGKDPPAFDILAWSVDGTNLTAKLHGQFIDIFENNPLARPGGVTVLRAPIDLKTIRLETMARPAPGGRFGRIGHSRAQTQRRPAAGLHRPR